MTAVEISGEGTLTLYPITSEQIVDAVITTEALEFFVAGRPAPQGSKRHVGNGIMVESSKAVAPWRTTVAWHAAQVHLGAPLDGALLVRLEFLMPRPTSLPKKKATPRHTKRPDVDKLTRAVNDALSGVIWRDDSQVVTQTVHKRYAELDEQPGVLIRVVPVP